MPETEIRPAVVALLCDSDFKYRRDTKTWSHIDGRPFTKEEQTTALHATRDEFEEFAAQHTRYMEYLRTTEEAPEALQRFLAPFMDQLTKKTLGNAVELTGEAERAQLDQLLGRMTEPPRRFTAYTF
ncbi:MULTISPECIES: hypothetical protein [unclassified Streptomyces]|uniref:hypothetical protein n=1 Tax=unclassified Streptomyces TaxID=2593676 RepID=UPI000DC769B8|nr:MULTISPECIES: hypothetical protein [unclassified Streptomyces]AWZ03621.1 hypothetical protein DRB89_02110 [Streptomyces sp. ICC4]AWZ11018.1 hypothetical protein DRB96_00215 [Streptomyces sp. ICC1]